jgi:hypothetical protein
MSSLSQGKKGLFRESEMLTTNMKDMRANVLSSLGDLVRETGQNDPWMGGVPSQQTGNNLTAIEFHLTLLHVKGKQQLNHIQDE